MSTFKERLFITPGYLIRRVQQRTVAIYTAATREKGLTPVQYIVLSTVEAHPGIDLSSLGDLLAVDPATTGSVVRRLAERGLIRSGRLAGDKRAKSAEITDAGRELKREMQAIVEEVQRDITAPLSDLERVAFLRIMRKLLGVEAATLQAPEGPRSAAAPVEATAAEELATAIIGVDRESGHLIAERLGAASRPLVLLSRDGNHAQDLANLMRVRGGAGVESRSCSPSSADGGTEPVSGLAKAMQGVRSAVFCGWGDDRDPHGALAADMAALDELLKRLASGGGGICVICGPLAATAPVLNSRWGASATRVVGVDPAGHSPKLAAELVLVLLNNPELSAGSLLKVDRATELVPGSG